MYAERRFDEAIENFRQVTEQFPNSTKVPDAQLKIGFSSQATPEDGSGRALIDIVIDMLILAERADDQPCMRYHAPPGSESCTGRE